MIAPRAWLAMAALPLLSGCVAAALPVLAAGGVLGTQRDGKDVRRADRGPPRVSVDISPAPAAGAPAPGTLVRNYTLDDGTRMEVMAGPLAAPAASPSSTMPAPAPAPAVRTTAMADNAPPQRIAAPTTQPPPPVSYVLDDGTRVQVIAGPMPAPSGAGTAPAGFAGYDDFYRFAAGQGALPIVGSERRSALLAAPGTLAPATKSCSIHPAAVLIDLDPGASVLDPATALRADPRLAGTLAALRGEGVTIGWLTANTADRAGAIRRALNASGLDPVGRDELVLLRYPEERKQTRREDFARAFCVVAIAGDERGDFDELFQYLKNPATSAPLEPLIGEGWFVIPQPLS